MSDSRKYRHRGYVDDDDREKASRPKGEGVPREMRAPLMPGFREVFRCSRCGNLIRGELALDTRCSRCGSDLHSCAQCVSFDPASRFECMQPITERITVKDARNSCTCFSAKTTLERETTSSGPTDARRAFDDLFK
ncbi:MAG: hypothetical protein ACRD1T_28025 [Acidimicrobiia bacterium]